MFLPLYVFLTGFCELSFVNDNFKCPNCANARNLFPLMNVFFSISASSATMYAYLGEFHSNIHRGRAIMGSALIFGVSCLLLPLIAWTIINQDWEFDVPLIDVRYKPWRFFIVVCGLPGFITSIALIFLPESPKFVFNSLGDSKRTIQILEQMNRWNNGKNSCLNLFEILEETESIENRQRILANKNSRFPLVKSIWTQTAPLFQASHLRSTLLICTIQFGIYATSNGLFMFFADIMNRMAHNVDHSSDQRIKMCDIINMGNTTNQNSENVSHPKICMFAHSMIVWNNNKWLCVV